MCLEEMKYGFLLSMDMMNLFYIRLLILGRKAEISHAMMKIILNSIWKDDMARILTLKN